MSDRASIDALRSIIHKVEELISTTTHMPENRTPRCLELLRAADALAEDIGRSPTG